MSAVSTGSARREPFPPRIDRRYAVGHLRFSRQVHPAPAFGGVEQLQPDGLGHPLATEVLEFRRTDHGTDLEVAVVTPHVDRDGVEADHLDDAPGDDLQNVVEIGALTELLRHAHHREKRCETHRRAAIHVNIVRCREDPWGRRTQP